MKCSLNIWGKNPFTAGREPGTHTSYKQAHALQQLLKILSRLVVFKVWLGNQLLEMQIPGPHPRLKPHLEGAGPRNL